MTNKMTNKMTERDIIKFIIRNNGDCSDLHCPDCPFVNRSCYTDADEDTLKLAKQWLKDNPEEPIIPELKPVLCEVWDGPTKPTSPSRANIIGHTGRGYLDKNNFFWNHAEPVKEEKPNLREMTRDEKLDWLIENLTYDGMPIKYPKVDDK